MKNFVLGVVTTLIVLAVIAYIAGHLGFVDMRADSSIQAPTGV